MHSFEVHSNESACIKKVRLGLEEAIAYWNLRMFVHRLGIQLEVTFKYILPGLLVWIPIQSLLLLNQGYVFWISLE